MVFPADAGVVALEIGAIILPVGGDRLIDGLFEAVEIVGARGGQGEALALDMDDVLGRGIAARDEALQVLGRAEFEDGVIGAMLQHEAARLALDRARQRDGAAQDRRDLGGAGELLRQAAGGERMRLPRASRFSALSIIAIICS